MLRLLRDRPWLLIVAAFVLLISAWTTLVFVAVRYGDRPVPVLRLGPP